MNTATRIANSLAKLATIPGPPVTHYLTALLGF